MDERVNVPIDDPNADTEWYEIESTQNILADRVGMTYSASMALFQRSLLRRRRS